MINFFSKYKFIFYLSNFILTSFIFISWKLLGCFYIMMSSYNLKLTQDFLVSQIMFMLLVNLSIIGLFTYKNSNKLNFLSIIFNIYFQ